MGRLVADIPPYDLSYDSIGTDIRLPKAFLLHGFMGDSRDWETVTASLSRSRMCVAPDLPGHGDTVTKRGPKESYSMRAVGLGVSRLIEQVAREPVDLIGYSMGGRLALYIAVYYPHLINRLILESSSPGLATEPEREQRRQHDENLARRLESKPYHEFLDFWYDQPLFATLKNDHLRFKRLLGRRREKADPRGLAMSLRMMGTGSQPSLWERLTEVTRPVLLIVGEKDDKFRDIAGRMAERLPDVRIDVVPEAGHNVHFEQLERYVVIVESFLTE